MKNLFKNVLLIFLSIVLIFCMGCSDNNSTEIDIFDDTILTTTITTTTSISTTTISTTATTLILETSSQFEYSSNFIECYANSVVNDEIVIKSYDEFKNYLDTLYYFEYSADEDKEELSTMYDENFFNDNILALKGFELGLNVNFMTDVINENGYININIAIDDNCPATMIGYYLVLVSIPKSSYNGERFSYTISNISYET